MPNALTVSQLLGAKKMITTGNLVGFYQYMANQGYKYATLAEGVVSASAPNGLAALGFMQASATAQGHPLSGAQINKIKIDMAHGWADALIGIASANGKVNADLTGQAILIMHNDVFQKNNLDPSTWTLYAPAQVLGPTQFNALFSDLLNSQGDMAKEIAMDAKIFFQMEACAQYCTDPALQNASLKWIGTAVNSLFSDIDFFLAEDARVGNAIPSGVLLNNLKSNSLTIGSDVNISALADQLAEAYIPKSSTVIASGGLLIDISPDPAATAAANAAARQQLVQSFSDQLQTLRSGASGISYGLAHQTLDGHTIDSITHFWASGAQQYQQTADTSPSGAINVAISGVGDVANFSGAAINISNDSSATVNGNSNYIKAGSGSLTALYGTGNVAKLVSNSGAVVQFYTANSTNTVKGSGNYIGVFATGESFNSSGNVFQFSQHGFGFSVTGDSNRIQLGGSSQSTLYGTGNLVEFIPGSGSLLHLTQANASNTVNGAGNTIGVLANGQNIASSGNVFNFSQGGFSIGIHGDSNWINAGASSGTGLYGTGNVVNFVPGSGSLVNLGTANAGTTVYGAGNTVGILATGQSVFTSGNAFSFSQGGYVTGIHGDSNWVSAGAGSYTGLYGVGNVANLVPGSGSLVHLYTAGATNTVYGAGNTVGILATGQTVVASGDAFNFSQGGFHTTIHGDSNWVNAGAGSYTGLFGNGNVANLVSGSGSLVHLYRGRDEHGQGRREYRGYSRYRSGHSLVGQHVQFFGQRLYGRDIRR